MLFWLHEIQPELIQCFVSYTHDVLFGTLLWVLFWNDPEVFHLFHILHDRYTIIWNPLVHLLYHKINQIEKMRMQISLDPADSFWCFWLTELYNKIEILFFLNRHKQDGRCLFSPPSLLYNLENAVTFKGWSFAIAE